MSKIEIELKYRIKYPEEVESKLKKLGAIFKKEFSGIDTYYIVPNNPNGKKYLRIREQDGKAEIHYHFAESQSHTKEWEVGVTDPTIAKEILNQLEYKIDVIVEKKRKVYTFLKSEIVLDQVKHLGNFIEIEAPTEEELKLIANNLNLHFEDQVQNAGYSDLLRNN